MPSLSVVVPVLDDEVMLARVLEALASQRVRPFEVIVVDNGSTDGSVAVALARGASVVREPHPGIPAAAAAGYDAARGDVIARLDADTVPPADWTARIGAAFNADPALDALTGPGIFTSLPPLRRVVLSALYMGLYFAVLDVVLGHVPLWGSNLALRRSAWHDVREAVHRDDPMVHDDLDLAIHLGAAHRLRFDPALVVAVGARAVSSRERARAAGDRMVHTARLHAARICRRRIGRLTAPGLGSLRYRSVRALTAQGR